MSLLSAKSLECFGRGSRPAEGHMFLEQVIITTDQAGVVANTEQGTRHKSVPH